jgi:hypothetical protein
MLFKMSLCLCKREDYHVQDFLHAKMMLFKMRLFVQESKLARASFPPQWNDVVQDVLLLL